MIYVILWLRRILEGVLDWQYCILFHAVNCLRSSYQTINIHAKFSNQFIRNSGKKYISEYEEHALNYYGDEFICIISFKIIIILFMDRLCGLVVRVSGYRSRGPGFDSRPYQIF
jgi:hypothetical protein